MLLRDRIDLHMHTRASDGTDAPSEVISLVREAGISLFSVTDHDTVKACAVIPPLLKDGDPRFLPGIEFSCKDEEGQYHVLGYGYDPDAPAIRATEEKGHRFRLEKLMERVSQLGTIFGFTFPQEEIDRLLALDNPGKPHLGNLMVALGYCPDKETAIRDYINKTRTPGKHIRPEDAIRAILASGGIPVLAHPAYGRGDELIIGEEMDHRLRKLIGFGLEGVEAFYSGFTEKLRDETLGFAARYGLYVTAGSDYHGSNKLVRLGDNGLLPGMEMPEGLRRFLERAESLTRAG